MQPFVSVLTPTYNRRQFIETAITCFKAQTYPMDRMEWLILDDGTDKVRDLFEASGLPNVRYIALPDGEKHKIGAKRNRLNVEARGEICVCWDDDDYYPPDRVRTAVTRLRSMLKQGIQVVGSSELILYFTDRREFWSIGPFAQNHCTNGTMAYWTVYGKTHQYDETVDKAEEASFMDGWKTRVYQLVPRDTMLVICHAANTHDKRTLFDKMGSNPTFRKVESKMQNIVKNKKIRDFYASLSLQG